MREWKVDLTAFCPDLSAPSSYEYAVLVEEVDLGSFACESYGVAVTAAAGDRAEVANITVSTRRLQELLELLIRCQVGPTHLRDVIEDWL